jgi:hypothetical protein
MKKGMTTVAIIALLSFGSAGRESVTAVSQECCVPAPSGLVSWWPGDGNANDIQGGRNGMLQNGATFMPGMVGQAFSFDGVNAFVQIPDSPAWFFGGNNFTIDLWVNFRSLAVDNPLVSNDEGGGSTNKWIFGVSSNNLTFHTNTSTGDSTSVTVPFAPLPDTWYHIAVVRSGTTFRFYVNGMAIGSDINPKPVPDANAPLTIGSAEAFRTDGLMDEVEIFNRALTALEIAAIFNAGSAGKCKRYVIEGNGHCLDVNTQTRTYRFKTASGRTFTGSLLMTQTGAGLRFQNRRGEGVLLRGQMNLGNQTGNAALVVPRSLGGGTFMLLDNHLCDNAPCP